MYPTKNNIPEKVRSQLIGMLQEHLCHSIDLKTHAKQAHWNVKGPDFIALHELFDQLALATENSTDVLAERIVQLGGVAEGTLKVAAKRTGLPEYPLNITSGVQHVNALSHSLASYGEDIRTAIGLSDELGDKATADILTEISRQTDKYLWLVESHVQAES